MNRRALLCRVGTVGVVALLAMPQAAARPLAKPRPVGARAAQAGGKLTDRRLREGEAAFKAGDLLGAERSFSEAYRLDGSQAALFQLGRVAQAQGRAVAAQDLLRRFLAAEGQGLPPDKRAEAER